MASPIDSANSFGELLSAISPSAPALTQRFDQVLPALLLPADAKQELSRLTDGTLTARSFMERKDLHRAVDSAVSYRHLLLAFKRWLTQQKVPAAAPVEHESVAALLELIAVPEVGQMCLASLTGEVRRYGDEFSFSSIAATPLRAGGVATAPALAALKLLREKVEKMRAEDRARGPLVDGLEATGHDWLDRFRGAVAVARQPLVPCYPFNCFQPQVYWQRIEGNALRASVSFDPNSPPGAVTFADVSTWVARPVLSCSCKRKGCLHLAGALDELLTDTTDPSSKFAKLLLAASLPPWQQALKEFDESLSAPVPRSEAPGVLSFRFERGGVVTASFHALGKKGKVKAGKALRVLAASARRLSGQDRKLAEAFALAEAESGYSPSKSAYYGDALMHLEGHPDVCWSDSPPMPVVATDARVVVEETPDGLHFRFFAGQVELDEQDLGFPASFGRVRPTPTKERILLVRLSTEVLRLFFSLSEHGAQFPKEALPALAPLLPRLEAAAQLELPEELQGQQLPPAARVVVRVEAAPVGLVLAVRTEPLPGGPLLVPGHGVPSSAAFDGRRRTHARRDFELERAAANALTGVLGLEQEAASEPWTWHLEPGAAQVEVVRRLSEQAQAGLTVEWKTPPMRFTSEARLDRLRLSVEKKRDWFGLEGEVQVDDRRVALAALLEAARARRRWVKLGEGDYAQLSEELVNQLAPLAHLAAEGKELTLTLGTVPLVDALAGQVESLQAVDGWKRLTERLAKARSFTPVVPKALKSTLRDYQIEGFNWLSRLAEWGAGACLADDMGLGKTLQALALLMSRARQGPALVVAPSSVLHTWRTEAERFAPSLELTLFHESDRKLGALKASQVVVTSWTLLAREADAFADTRFATVVLDEAHAIKNAGTLRARAAHRLQADFVVALSGTPVENHVGELWSLFRAVMPSLLGSEESFRQRFGGSSREAVSALSKLVQPFILRRTKGEVAKELPARTESEVVVPLSAEERALYDDVRLAALNELGEVGTGDARFQVLAALTRLRLTACHPRLVDAGWTGPTSKLTRLLELVKDLSAGGHRALVFSQFTQHLALVAEALRAEGVVHSYLDGKVPLAERQRRVELFQRGEGGDVFLISLKAGGTGLTLTAADFVIHLDPWWNPAVEDQASDRAHRIGQDKPVTIYRLIAEGTIEQQILSLHKEKRELVDALLAGADVAGKLSTAQLAALIRG